MNRVKQPVNPSLAEVVKSVLDIDDCDLISNVITVLITPRKTTQKNRTSNYLYQSKTGA